MDIPKARVNHLSVVARDLEESVRFYVELFGMVPIATPNFGFPVQWLAVGGLQFHLFQRAEAAPTHHHVAFTVAHDDFPAFYRQVRQLGITDDQRFGHHLYRLPGDAAQLYILDPSDNLIEVDCAKASLLPAEIQAEMRPLAAPQTPESAAATLYLEQP